MYTHQNLINNVYGFVNKEKTPIDGLTVRYETEGFYGGKHRVHIEVKNSLGIVKITFALCDFWGYVNPLGECYLNDVLIKTDTLVKYTYDRNKCALVCITDALLKL